jgi:hypothetical protein
LTMEYIRKFLPPITLLKLMKSMLANVHVPAYISPTERAKYDTWISSQNQYADDAISLHSR